MIPRKGHRFYVVRDVISLFVQMGCELRTAEATVTDDEGTWNVRYLVNPAEGLIVGLVDLGDEEQISAGEVGEWERRLNMTIPKPQPQD